MKGSQKTLFVDACVQGFSFVFLCFGVKQCAQQNLRSEIRTLCAKHIFLDIPLYAVHKGTFEKKKTFLAPQYMLYTRGLLKFKRFGFGRVIFPPASEFFGPKKRQWCP